MSGRSGEARRLALMQQALAEDARAEIVGDTRLLNGLVARAERKDRRAAGEHDQTRRRLVRRSGDVLWMQAERVERKIEGDNAAFANSMAALASAERRAVSSRTRASASGRRKRMFEYGRSLRKAPAGRRSRGPVRRGPVPMISSVVPPARSHGACEVRQAGRRWVRCCEGFDARGRKAERCVPARPPRPVPVRRRPRGSRRPTTRSARR